MPERHSQKSSETLREKLFLIKRKLTRIKQKIIPRLRTSIPSLGTDIRNLGICIRKLRTKFGSTLEEIRRRHLPSLILGTESLTRLLPRK